jgi:hypothetical protein
MFLHCLFLLVKLTGYSELAMRVQLATNLRVVACRWRNNTRYYTIDYVVPHSRCTDECSAMMATDTRRPFFKQ